ncbi:cyclic nucleotide-binding domain-containing protein [bacterium AH-315-P15]|nr:cyclic nucleotide-binding domain-containing protein [bacterium AH-315-P15]
MSLREEVELLRKVPVFANVELSKLKLLAFTSERMCFDAGQEVFHQGDAGDAAYVIIEGIAEVLVDSATGPLKILEFEPHAFVGEIAILCDVPRTATVIAKTELHTLRISKELFFRLMEEFPQMAIEIMRVLALRLEHTTAELTTARNRLREANLED